MFSFFSLKKDTAHHCRTVLKAVIRNISIHLFHILFINITHTIVYIHLFERSSSLLAFYHPWLLANYSFSRKGMTDFSNALIFNDNVFDGNFSISRRWTYPPSVDITWRREKPESDVRLLSAWLLASFDEASRVPRVPHIRAHASRIGNGWRTDIYI